MGNEFSVTIAEEMALEEGKRSFLSKFETAMRTGDISSGEEQQGQAAAMLQSFDVGLCCFFTCVYICLPI